MNNFDKKEKNLLELYGKEDIMKMFKCESDKALKILKLMFQMKEANKIGKEYYVYKEDLVGFLDRYKGHKLFL